MKPVLIRVYVIDHSILLISVLYIMNQTPEQPAPAPYPNWLIYAIIIFGLALVYIWYTGTFKQPVSLPIPYSQFKELVYEGEVMEVLIRGPEVEVRLRLPMALGPEGEKGTQYHTRVPSFGDESLLPALEARNVIVTIGEERGQRTMLTVLLAMLPWIFLILFFYFIYQRASKTLGGRIGGPEELKKFLESPAKETGVPEVTFADVAGQENAKREVVELVEFLKIRMSSASLALKYRAVYC